jgi:non-specific serine/threonine protein kinase/serine/threonine-protein kinase
LPFDSKKNVNEVLRQVREDEPPRPSTKIATDKKSSTGSAQNRGSEPRQLEKLLRGDLDWITMKALEKDRTRRYGTPSDMAADITRYLDHEPVVARPASTAYRLHKYVRRHRIAVGVATGLLAMLAVFAVVQRVQLQRTRLERDRANRERDRATRITDFMTGMFTVSDPSEQRGNSVTAREILDKASKNVETEMAKDPDAQAQMMQVMGKVYLNLGLLPRAKDLEQQSLDIRRQVLGPENPDTLASMDYLAEALMDGAHFAEAAKMFREELDIERRVLGPENPQTLTAMNNLAHALWRDDHYAEAEKMDRELLPLRRRVLGPENRDTLTTMSNLALDLQSQGRKAEAEKMDREVLEIRRRVLGPDHPDTVLSIAQLAFDLTRQNRFAEAEKLDREVFDIRRRVLGPEHFDTLTAMSGLAWVVFVEDRYAEAEKLNRETLYIERKVLGPEHSYTLGTMGQLAVVLTIEGRDAEAEKLSADFIDISRRVFGPDNPDTATTVYNLGCAEAHRGNRPKALSLLRQAVDHGLPPFAALGMEKDPDLKSLHGDSRYIALLAYAKQRSTANPK